MRLLGHLDYLMLKGFTWRVDIDLLVIFSVLKLLACVFVKYLVGFSLFKLQFMHSFAYHLKSRMKRKLVVVCLILTAIACSKKQNTPTPAFSPNGDGINDYWTFTGFDNDPDAEIKVYSKDGLLVFECAGSNPVWDGKYRNTDAPPGIYYYTIVTRYKKDPVRGSLMLIR